MAVIDLKGVVEVGGTRDPKVPVNPRITLRLIKRETTTIRVFIQKSDGTLDTGAAANVILTVRKKPLITPALSKSVVLDEFSVATFTIAENEIGDLVPAGRYLYDIIRDRGTDRQSVIITAIGGVVGYYILKLRFAHLDKQFVAKQNEVLKHERIHDELQGTVSRLESELGRAYVALENGAEEIARLRADIADCTDPDLLLSRLDRVLQALQGDT